MIYLSHSVAHNGQVLLDVLLVGILLGSPHQTGLPALKISSLHIHHTQIMQRLCVTRVTLQDAFKVLNRYKNRQTWQNLTGCSQILHRYENRQTAKLYKEAPVEISRPSVVHLVNEDTYFETVLTFVRNHMGQISYLIYPCKTKIMRVVMILTCNASKDDTSRC